MKPISSDIAIHVLDNIFPIWTILKDQTVTILALSPHLPHEVTIGSGATVGEAAEHLLQNSLDWTQRVISRATK